MLIKNIQETTLDDLSRVEVSINGKTLWFESRDAQLSLNAEAFASALLFSSLVRHQPLKFEIPLSSQFLGGVEKLLPIFNNWWNYPVLLPTGKGEYSSGQKPATGIGQCFTCGVDSFHTLVNNLQKVSHLIFVCGYDIPLHFKDRMAVTYKALKEIADYYNKKLIVVRTNLREHLIFKGVNWEHAHGGALAAVGHLLCNEIGHLVIPSTFMYQEQKAWGSTVETDPLWSSERLQVYQFGASQIRLQKIKSIVNVPMANKHLRVCWEMRNPLINCSECEKCLRTMLGISLWAPVQNFVQFNHSLSLEKRIDSLPFITRHTYPYYRDFLESTLDEKLKNAIKRLIQRSRSINPTKRN